MRVIEKRLEKNRPQGGLIIIGSPYQIRTGDLRLERAAS